VASNDEKKDSFEMSTIESKDHTGSSLRPLFSTSSTWRVAGSSSRSAHVAWLNSSPLSVGASGLHSHTCATRGCASNCGSTAPGRRKARRRMATWPGCKPY